MTLLERMTLTRRVIRITDTVVRMGGYEDVSIHPHPTIRGYVLVFRKDETHSKAAILPQATLNRDGDIEIVASIRSQLTWRRKR